MERAAGQQPTLPTSAQPQRKARKAWYKSATIFVPTITVAVIVAGIVVFFFYQRTREVRRVTLPVSDQVGREMPDREAKEVRKKFRDPSGTIVEAGRLIARVLNIKPFIVETLDIGEERWKEQLPFHSINTELEVAESDREKLRSLEFNDIISGDIYPISAAAGDVVRGSSPVEHGFSLPRSELRNIQILGKLGSPQANKANPFVRREPTLIRYHARDSGLLVISESGSLYYYYDTIRTGKLTKRELDNILKQMTRTNLGDIPLDFTVPGASRSLILLRNQYQPIALDDHNLPKLRPIITLLDDLIATQRSEAVRRLQYEKRHRIKNWEYGHILSLGEAMKTSFRTENKTRLSQIKPSEELLKEIENTYYRENGRLYHVYFGKCVDGSAGTWGCFAKNAELVEADTEKWPTELGIKLTKVPREGGILIPRDEYSAHQVFYDSLLGKYEPFIEGEYLYPYLKISLEWE